MADRTVNFSLFYDSSDEQSPLKNHEMNLSELGDALKGMSDVLTTANDLINGEDEPITVRTKAGFKKGSFGIPIEIIQNASAVDILQVIGLVSCAGQFVAGSALEVIRKLRSRKIDIIEGVDDDQVTVKVAGESIDCNKYAKKLVVNPKFREAVSQVFTKPVTRDGVDQVGLRFDSDGEQQDQISLLSEDAFSMAVPDEIFERNVDTRFDETQVKFLSAHADRSDKWRVMHYGKALSVEITDQGFLERLRHEEGNFNFGREFTVTLKTIISRRNGSRRESKSYEIVRVHHESLG